MHQSEELMSPEENVRRRDRHHHMNEKYLVTNLKLNK